MTSVLPLDPAVSEDVVDGADGNLVPAVSQNAGSGLRWWTGKGHASDLGAYHAEKVASVGIGLDKHANHMRASGFEPGRGCFDHIRIDVKGLHFGHSDLPVSASIKALPSPIQARRSAPRESGASA